MKMKNSTLLVVLSLCSALKLPTELRSLKTDTQWAMDSDMDSAYFGNEALLVQEHPLSKRDVQYLEASGQRAEMEGALKAFIGKSFIFIGDSQMRNQYQALCLLMKAAPSGDQLNEDSQCSGGGTSAFFTWKTHTDPQAMSEILSKGIQQPDVIYWNAAQNWADIVTHQQFFEALPFRSNVEKAVQSYTEAAPNSKIVFFLSPMPHAELKHQKHAISVQRMNDLNGICRQTMQAHKDGQGRRIGVVDAFNLTKDQISFTDDGVHYNRLAWKELSSMLTAARS